MASPIPPRIQDIIHEEAARFALIPEYARSPCQDREAVQLRRAIALRLHNEGIDDKRIARYLGNRDRSTIYYLRKNASPAEQAEADRRSPRKPPKSEGPAPCPDLSGEWAI